MDETKELNHVYDAYPDMASNYYQEQESLCFCCHMYQPIFGLGYCRECPNHLVAEICPLILEAIING